MISPADSRWTHTDCFGDLPPRESLSSKLKSAISLEYLKAEETEQARRVALGPFGGDRGLEQFDAPGTPNN